MIGVYDGLGIVGAIMGFSLPAALTGAYNLIPLASQGFAWILPAVLGGIIGGLIGKNRQTNI